MTQSEIQARLAFCSHNKNLKDLKKNPNYDYIQPPVGQFSAMKFGMFDEIRRAGYHHGTTFFAGLRKANAASQGQAGPWNWVPTSGRQADRTAPAPDDPATFSGRKSSSSSSMSSSAASSKRSYTFTDLAEMVAGVSGGGGGGGGGGQQRMTAGERRMRNSVRRMARHNLAGLCMTEEDEEEMDRASLASDSTCSDVISGIF